MILNVKPKEDMHNLQVVLAPSTTSLIAFFISPELSCTSERFNGHLHEW